MLNVVIPIYKARETLPDALNSLVAQTKKLFIVTLSQDGDGEDYSDIIQEYKRRGLQIRLVKSEVNGGPGVARQRGIDADTMCDYVSFLDADDMYMPRAIDLMYREAKGNNLDLLITDFMAEQKYQGTVYLAAEKTSITWCHNKCYRKQYLVDNNIRFLDGLRLNEDAYFNVVGVNCTKNVKRVNECTYLWRDNKESLTRDKGEGGFFIKSWKDYVRSQVEGMKKIVEITGSVDPSLLAQTLIHVYCHVMKALHYKLDLEEAKVLFQGFGEIEQIKKCFKEEEFWKVINEKLSASEISDGEMIFYSQRFCDWLLEFVSGDIFS